jgi:4-alpha-glucanotransferase
MQADGYRWWIERMRTTLALVDIVRLDHFRGFEAFWEIPGDASTAVNGRWVPGPGGALFDALQAELGDLPIVAENLGVITPAVEALRKKFGFPGMAILQFAFGTDPQAPDFRPHNFTRDRVAFTGTHDNDTVVGWWTSLDAGHSTRTAADINREREYARRYLNTDGTEINWAFIRAVTASVADTAIVPMQDVLGLGSEARMNVPARPTGNWRWRLAPGASSADLSDRLAHLTALYERASLE